jgi:cytochrome c553
MKKNLLITLTILFGLTFFWSSCSNNDDEDPNPTFTLTQQELNNATTEEEMNATGRQWGESSIPHGGSDLTYDDTYRDIYSNASKKSANAEAVGTVITKRTYVKNADGSKGELLVTFAMAKRESGYFPEGGDWEYVMMPNDGTNDYGENPNGMLPDASNTNMRGQLGNCAGCHATAGNDYLFSQSEMPAFEATQADLNNATLEEELNITGAKYGEDVSIPHGGMSESWDSTFRDVYSNTREKESIRVGSVITKRTYARNADGSRGALLVTFAMIKREAGYFAEGGDYEWVMMPNDGSNDYDENPNGMLPDVSMTLMRGKLESCAGCHAKADGGDYSFVRN